MFSGTRILWILAAVSACIGTIYGLLLVAEPASPTLRTLQSATHLAAAVTYLVSVLLCLRIARDYRDASTMRLAWRLIAAHAVAAAVRHGFESAAAVLRWLDTHPVTLTSLRQIPIALSLILLALGLIAKWSSFASIGMGLKLHWADITALAMIVLLVLATFSLRSSMYDSQSQYPWIRYLQSASPVLLALPAGVSVVLHRISREVGGGQLANSLRLMTVFLAMRLFSLFVGLLPDSVVLTVLSRTLFWLAPSMFLLAAAYRLRLTISAEQLAARCEADSTAALAGVSSGRWPSQISRFPR